MNLPTIECLREMFRYDAESGLIYSLRPKRNGVSQDMPIGWAEPRGYIRIQVGKGNIAAHRLAWALHYGEWPKDIDHIDHDKGNNRIENLREATRYQNMANRPGSGKISAKGVCLTSDGKMYRATIRTSGLRVHLGTFASIDEAAHAYNKAVFAHFGEFALLNPIGQDKQ